MKFSKRYYNFKSELFGTEAIVIDIIYAPMLIGGFELKVHSAQVVKVIKDNIEYPIYVGDIIPVYPHQCVEVPQPDDILKETL